jgi:hypothetical protein
MHILISFSHKFLGIQVNLNDNDDVEVEKSTLCQKVSRHYVIIDELIL